MKPKVKILSRIFDKSSHALVKENEALRKTLQAKSEKLAEQQNALRLEASIDRIRTRALAMRKSEEILQIVGLLRREMRRLELHQVIAATICLTQPNGMMRMWDITSADQIKGPKSNWDLSFPIKGLPGRLYIRRLLNVKKKYFLIEQNGKDLAVMVKWLAQYKKDDAEEIKSVIKKKKIKRTWHPAVRLAHGVLCVDCLEPPAAEIKHVLVKMGAAFDLAYRRFLDLQKAEERTKEAKLEAALESIRSRSLAMRRSDELKDVMVVMLKRLGEFNLVRTSIAIQLFSVQAKSCRFWVSNDLQDAALIMLPFDRQVMKKRSYLRDSWRAKLSNRDLINKTYTKSEKDNFFKYVFSNNAAIPPDARKFIRQAKSHTVCLFVNQNSALFADGFDSDPFSHEEVRILKKVAQVFEQAYIRFLDVQKAEEQAREAQIEAALEKVRSRSLAMHRSEEMPAVMNLVFEKLRDLDIQMDAASIVIPRDNSNDRDFWIAIPDRSYTTSVFLPYIDFSVSRDLLMAADRQIDFYSKRYSFREKNRWWHYAFKHSGFKAIPEERKKLILASRHFSISAALTKNLALIVTNYSEKILIGQEEEILKRFSRVFDQAYIRFLDLQKAEQQAREAQIEAALERVRSRGMAMHKTTELHELIGTMYQQLSVLGVSAHRCFITITDPASRNTTWWMASPESPGLHRGYVTPDGGHAIYRSYLKGFKDKEQKWVRMFEGAEKRKWDDFLFSKTDFRFLPPPVQDAMRNVDKAYWAGAFNHFGAVTIGNLEPVADEIFNILQRFSKIFEQTYTRFLDLQKAEFQAREAQIEVAVERVRAKALAMHKSEEIFHVLKTLRREMDGLSIEGVIAASIYLRREDGQIRLWDLTTVSDSNSDDVLMMDEVLPIDVAPEHLWFRKMLVRKEKYFIIERDERDLDVSTEWIRKYVNEELANSFIEFGKAKGINHMWHPTVQLEHGLLTLDFVKAPPPAEIEPILLKMGAAFDLAYKRFLDLKKAEAQARESQIEASLERVRSRSMAMHKSDELSDIIAVLNGELKGLGISFDTSSIITEFNPVTFEGFVHYVSLKGGVQVHRITKGIVDHTVTDRFKDALKRHIAFYVEQYSAEQRNDYLTKYNALAKAISEERLKELMKSPGWTRSNIVTDNFIISIARYNNTYFSDSENEIFKRFGKVFEQAYTRFQDLQKAEAQAREAKIEAALERVRSRSLAMHKSSELQEVIRVVLECLDKLGIGMDTANVIIPDKARQFVYSWVASKGFEYTRGFRGPFSMRSKIFSDLIAAYDSEQEFFAKSYSVEEKNEYLRELFDRSDFGTIPEERKRMLLALPHYAVTTAGTPNSWIQVVSYSGEILDSQQAEILRRFARVFEQCYIRFQDLEKAEAQARDATIEAALERVRARTMAMQRSDELAEAAQLLYQQFLSLGFKTVTCAYMFIDEERNIQSGWTVLPDGTLLPQMLDFPLTGDPVLNERYASWIEKKPLHVATLSGALNKQHHKFLADRVAGHISNDIFVHIPDTVHFYSANFSNGYLFIITTELLSESEENTVVRFAKVFEQTYIRFQDLQKAEASAKEAVRRASVDRVRAEIASMRTTSDLERITPLIWRELKTLGVPFVRCGLFIIDDEQRQIQTFLSTPDGQAIAAFTGTYETSSNLSEAIHNWRQHKRYVTHWKGKDFQAQADTLVKKGAISSREQYLSAIPDEGIVLHFLPFLQGTLYVGHTSALTEDDLQLVQAVADAFSTAYARYEDFNKLESTKRQVEIALADLTQTQQQLLQSEKMASLGELTAGIAHEIQNPLNFVNNFSEVSNELIKEIQELRLKGDGQRDEAAESEILNDIAQNLEKINHHGKRADAIVKSMLLHSRKSSGQKEPTDLNALCDEYLRLSYHGLRAKDKSFNAKFEMELDSTLPPANVVRQDIGRVILNLINNAFYAVTEKRKANTNGYEPFVKVSTRQLGNIAQIIVSDNGTGIPDRVKEKIFQPFFTTKPAGQGTGLGLSLTYDIITKGHGGEIVCESESGVGTQFKIHLPI